MKNNRLEGGRQMKKKDGYSAGPFTVDEIGFIQTAEAKVLAAIARGEIDLNRIAREELANRGLGRHGEWVGFKAAEKIHGVEEGEGTDTTTERTIQKIAADHLSIDTLETRTSDSLDFHEVSVWGIKAALQAAFDAGHKTHGTN